jgi:hypothetical protein
MPKRRDKEFVTIRKDGKLVTVPVADANVTTTPVTANTRTVPAAKVGEDPLAYAKRLNLIRRREKREDEIQYAAQSSGGIQPPSDCWRSPDSITGSVMDLLREASNYPSPPKKTCPPGFVLDAACEAAASAAWILCLLSAKSGLAAALDRAMFKYFSPLYMEAGRQLTTGLEICDSMHQSLQGRRQCYLRVYGMYCNMDGRKEANDEFENDLIGAMTDFYNKMLICDNTYRNTDCCVATDN